MKACRNMTHTTEDSHLWKVFRGTAGEIAIEMQRELRGEARWSVLGK